MTAMPKQLLIGNLEQIFRHRQIHLGSACPGLDALRQEPTRFQCLVTPSGHETYSSKATGHDDLVLSLALACQAVRQHKQHNKPSSGRQALH